MTLVRVLYDSSALLFVTGGISVYIDQLAQALAAQAPAVELITSQLDNGPRQRVGGVRGKLRALSWDTLYTHLLLPWRAVAARADLIHATGLRVPLRATVPVVTTIHDITPILFPQLFRYRDAVLLTAYLRYSARTAHHIATVSEQSRRDICAHLGVPPARVSVTNNAAAPHFAPVGQAKIEAVLGRLGVQRPYLLSVGNVEPRKNLARVLEAYARLRHERGIPHRLVLVGRAGPLAGPILQRAAELGLADDVHFTGYVADDDLPALYSGAALFVYASLYEGFGIPLLEAMACACPVVASNASSLPEVVGEAGLMVEPRDTAALAEAMGRVLDTPALADELRGRGLARAQLFSWQRCAQETAAVYRRALER